MRQIPDGALQLQHQLEQWRATQPARTKLPEVLWQAAVELAQRHGVYPIAKALRLDYAALKRRLSGMSATRKTAERTEFVELVGPGARLHEFAIEFESRPGSKMRIQWKAPTAPDWSSLLRAWRDTEKE